MIEYQMSLPNSGRSVSLPVLVEIAQTADQLGFTTLWVHDHVLPPREMKDSLGEILEPLVLLAYLAARVDRIRLGTCICVVPMRNPFNIAKQAVTIDVLSGGRLTLGVGAGYLEAEYRNVHEDYGTRGRRLNEAIMLFRHLFAGHESFEGRYYGYADAVFGPAPVQGSALPIMVGGHSTSAVRRAAMLGDMWQPSGITPERYRERLELLRELSGDRHVRAGIGIGVSTGKVQRWDTPDPHNLTDEIAEWEEAGAEYVNISFGIAEGYVARMEDFAAGRERYRAARQPLPRAAITTPGFTKAGETARPPAHSSDGSRLLFGNVAPDGAILKDGGSSAKRWIRGRTKVYGSEREAVGAVERGEVKCGTVLVVGSPHGDCAHERSEMTALADAIARVGLVSSIAVVTGGSLPSIPGGLLVERVGLSANRVDPLSMIRTGDLVCVDVDAGRIDAEYANFGDRTTNPGGE